MLKYYLKQDNVTPHPHKIILFEPLLRLIQFLSDLKVLFIQCSLFRLDLRYIKIYHFKEYYTSPLLKREGVIAPNFHTLYLSPPHLRSFLMFDLNYTKIKSYVFLNLIC